jgi:hypothetical protein
MMLYDAPHYVSATSPQSSPKEREQARKRENMKGKKQDIAAMFQSRLNSIKN